jgi:hypothetical protein
VDLVPLQLRLLSAPDIARKIFEQRPESYYALEHQSELGSIYGMSPDDRDGGLDFDDAHEGSSAGNTRQDALMKRAMLCDRPPPGARLLRILTTLQFVRLDSASTPSSAALVLSPCDQAAIRLTLLRAALNVGDLEGAYRICRVLLDSLQSSAKLTSGSTTEPLIESDEWKWHILQNDIAEASSLVSGLLDDIAYRYASGEEDLANKKATTTLLSPEVAQALRDDLKSAMLASLPVQQLDSCVGLWRAETGAALYGHSHNSNYGCFDSVNVDLARAALLHVIAHKIKNPMDKSAICTPQSSAHELANSKFLHYFLFSFDC